MSKINLNYQSNTLSMLKYNLNNGSQKIKNKDAMSLIEDIETLHEEVYRLNTVLSEIISSRGEVEVVHLLALRGMTNNQRDVRA